MATNLAVVENGGAIEQIKNDPFMVKLEAMRDAIAPNTTDAEFMLFGEVCKSTGLNPFAKQIYCIKRGKGDDAKATFQTSIDGYRLAAARSGAYAGNAEPVFDEGLTMYEHIKAERPHPEVATVTVYRMVQGHKCEFTASASWEQYKQEFWDRYKKEWKLGNMWAKFPHLMLAKCAESLALRKAFPAELSGVYTQEEMSQAGAVPEPIPTEPTQYEAAISPNTVRTDALVKTVSNASRQRLKAVCDGLGIDKKHMAEFVGNAMISAGLPDLEPAQLDKQQCDVVVKWLCAAYGFSINGLFNAPKHARNALEQLIGEWGDGTVSLDEDDDLLVAEWLKEIDRRIAEKRGEPQPVEAEVVDEDEEF